MSRLIPPNFQRPIKLFAGSALGSRFCSFGAIFAPVQWSPPLRLASNDPSIAVAFGHQKLACVPEHDV